MHDGCQQVLPFCAFDYVWEIYRRPAEVRYGGYVMPIPLGDRLVGRLNPRFDEARRSLAIAGLWLEDERRAWQEGPRSGLALDLGSSAQRLWPWVLRCRTSCGGPSRAGSGQCSGIHWSDQGGGRWRGS